MRKWLWLAFLFALPLAAQVTSPSVQYVTTAPSGSCTGGIPIQIVKSTGVPYTCNNGTWGSAGGGGGAWSALTAPTANLSLSMGSYNTAYGNTNNFAAASSFTSPWQIAGNSFPFGTEWNILYATFMPNAYPSDEFDVGLAVPNTSSNFQSNALAGFVSCAQPTGNHYCVGSYAQGRRAATGSAVDAFNANVNDGNFSGSYLYAGEFNSQVQNAASQSATVLVSANIYNASTPYDGVQIQSTYTYPYRNALWLEDNSGTTGIAIGETTSTGNSMPVSWKTAAGTYNEYVDAGGVYHPPGTLPSTPTNWPPSAAGPTFSPAAGAVSSGTTVTDTCPGSSTPYISSGTTPVAGSTGIAVTSTTTLFGSCQGGGYFTTGSSTYTVGGLLDAIGGTSTAIFAGSFSHLLKASWGSSGTPYAFQIERASDSTLTNVGFNSNGTVNQTTITSFCSGTTCNVMTLYDQSNSGHNATQATFANAPVVYTGGAVVTAGNNNQVAGKWDGTQRYLTVSYTFSAASNAYNEALIVANANSSIEQYGGALEFTDGTHSGGAQVGLVNMLDYFNVSPTQVANGGSGTVSAFQTITLGTQFLIDSYAQPGAVTSLSLNGGSFASGTNNLSSTFNATDILIGADRPTGTYPWYGTESDVVIFSGSSSAILTSGQRTTAHSYESTFFGTP